MKQQYDQYKNVVKLLKSNISAKYPISIHRVKMAETLHGDCNLIDKKFRIRINKDLDQWMAIETVIHEVAHCLSWNEKQDYHWYGWGIAFSKVYRIYLREYIEKP